MSYIKIDQEKCKGCGLCEKICPKNVIEKANTVNSKGWQPYSPIRNENCIACLACGLICPDVAIEIYKE